MKYLFPGLGAVLVLAFLALIVLQVGQAVKRTFSPPAGLAQVDRSTPAFQNGLTLLGVQNVSPDQSYNYWDQQGMQNNGSGAPGSETDTGLWVKMPAAFSLPSNCDASYYNHCDQAVSATARTSDGLQFPLHVRTTSIRNTADPVIILLDLPAGYPNTVRWADVTMDDHNGGHATWRITHLPHMQHAIPPPVTAQTTFRQGAIHAIARAYEGQDPNGNLKGQTLLCDLTGTVKPSPHQWEVGPMTLTREWEAPGYTAPGGNSSYGTTKTNGMTHFETNGQTVYYQQAEPYLTDTHWVRLTADLQEFETYDETVVFHNLSVIKTSDGNRFLISPRPETVTTPSGIVATLIDPRTSKDFHYSDEVSTASLMIHFSPAASVASLPASPLWRQFKGVVTLSCSVSKPYTAGGSMTNGGDATYSFHSDQPLPRVIANFPVLIHQSVNLRMIPMTFTLPVEKKGT